VLGDPDLYPDEFKAWLPRWLGGQRQLLRSRHAASGRGTVKLGAAIPGVIFTLPAGYRPQYNEIFPAASNNAYGQVSVSTAGDVTASVGSTAWITLNGISFRAYS
jgi:hypothetical protein